MRPARHAVKCSFGASSAQQDFLKRTTLQCLAAHSADMEQTPKVKSDTLTRRCGAGRGWAARSLRPRSWTASACGYLAQRGILRWTAMCPSRTDTRSSVVGGLRSVVYCQHLDPRGATCPYPIGVGQRPSCTDQAAGTLLIAQGQVGPSRLRAAGLFCCWWPALMSRGA